MKNKTTIIWDWNGTLLDDVRMCVETINILLKQRELPLLDLEGYRNVFTFPVIDYYRTVGFDFDQESFEKPAMEFMNLYHNKLPDVSLFEEVVSVLNEFNTKGITQLVLSAMEQDSLMHSLKDHRILSYFEHVSGLSDYYANGKKALGEQLIAKLGQPLNELVLIGDTLHDKEVADHLGIDVVLISNGHQSKSRLEKSGARVISSLKELVFLIPIIN